MTTSRSLRRRRGAAELPARSTADPAPTSALEPRAIVVVGTPQPSAEPAVDSVVDGAADDPAALAEAARQAAREAREEAVRTVDEAQAEARRIVDEAKSQAADLERAGRDADAEAQRWQVVADRDAAIVSTEGDVISLQASRDHLGAEMVDLQAEAARLEARLRELAADEAEAQQRRVMAVRGDDSAGLRDACAALTSAAELARARAGDLDAVRARHAAVQAEHEEVCDALGRAALRLIALRRAEAGLPLVAEVVEMALSLLPALTVGLMQSEPEHLLAVLLRSVPADQQATMREAIALGPHAPLSMIGLASTVVGAVRGPQLVSSIQSLALSDPGEYEALRRQLLDDTTPRPMTAQEQHQAVAADGAARVGAKLWAGGAL